MTIGGDLVVNGTTTTVNSTITTLDDPIITLGGDTAPSSDDAKDRGVEFRYYDSTAKTGFFGLDRSSLEYVFLSNTSNSTLKLLLVQMALFALVLCILLGLARLLMLMPMPILMAP